MFEAAKNFVIQNGVFIDVNGNAKLYKKKSFPVASYGHQGNDKSENSIDRLSDYQRFKMGDVHVLDGIVQADKIYNDVVVEVSGENKKRAARIYRGPQGNTQLKMELELLSQSYPHPRIRQVFGTFKCNDATGLVFHDDGAHRRYGEYTSSLQPLQRASFGIKYISDYISTLKYFDQCIDLFNGENDGYYCCGVVLDQFRVRSKERSDAADSQVDFYVNSSGRLITVLSIPSNFYYSQDDDNYYLQIVNSWNTQKSPENLSQSDLEIVQFILRSNGNISVSHIHTVEQLISIFHRAFLSVMKTRFTIPDQEIESFLGHSVVAWPDFRETLHIKCIHYICNHFKVTQED
ncbi:hypothetical protein BDQ17DRAFT_1547255, partial [Cyathus striatus]